MTSEVLVLRHCVRSTTTDVGDADASDFTDLALPAWGVPPKWCTAQGLDIVERTGARLPSLLGAALAAEAPLRVVADPVLRDADSALALLRGLGREREKVWYDALLFDTLDPEVGEPLCSAAYTDAELAEAVRAGVAAVPAPMPLREAEALLTRLVGVGRAGPLGELPPPAVDAGGHLTGSAAVLRRLGQTIFYAFATGAAYPLHTNFSAAELYALLGWQHYYRAVKARTAKYATANAALLEAVLRDLAAPAPRTAIYVGHDGNLDGLAALLNLRWEAPPYLGGELLPTPPGSGLRFSASGGEVRVSFVYPVYADAGTPPVRNASGRLEESAIVSLSAEALGDRARLGLRSFAGAEPCFDLAAARAAAPLLDLRGRAAPLEVAAAFAGALVVVALLASVWFCWLRRLRRPANAAMRANRAIELRD